MLKKGNLSEVKERYLRLRIWWAGNDKRRVARDKTNNITDAEKENLRVLVKLFDHSDDKDLIMIAEIKRELGDFEGVLELLKRPFRKDFSKAVQTIRELARKKNSIVAEIEFGD